MSLLPTLKLRLGSFAHLVDINRIPGLDGIKEEGGALRIGAMTRQAALERSELIRKKYPILADAVPLIADPLVRNRGTVGGNVANGDPANDQPAIMIALGATLVARGPKGERTIAANKFYTGLYETALARDEILTEIRIPVPPAKSGGAYQKLKRKTGDFAVAAVAVQMTLDARGAVASCGIALTNAGPTPLEAVEAAKFLTGKTPGAKPITAARSSTRRTWRACSPLARCRRRSSARGGVSHGHAQDQRHGERRRARGRGGVAPAPRAPGARSGPHDRHA